MRFLKARSDEISSAAAILGVIIGIVGFGLTWWQLSNTERALRAANTYQIQKDAREIVEKIISDSNFRAFVSSNSQQEFTKDIETKLWQMNNFYLSVYRQGKAGGVSDDFLNSIKLDFCKFVSRTNVSSAWEKMKSSGQISEELQVARSSWCK